MTDIFEQDAEAFSVEDEDISSIASLAKRAKELEKELEELNAIVSEKKDKYRKLTEEAIPELLATLGMKAFKMEDGSSVEVKPFYSASISEARRAEAFEWLRAHGHDDIIKNTVSVRFGRGEDELSVRLIDLLRERGYPVEQAEKIEPMTLKAWVREQIERGGEFPSDLFGAYVGHRALIKS